MESRRHKSIAKKLAAKFGAEYPPKKGPDIRTPRLVAEVEVDPAKFSEGKKQVQGQSTKKAYIVVEGKQVPKARLTTKGTGVGVMKADGTAAKRARAPRSRTK